MRCAMCRQGETKPGKATVTLEKKSTVVVVRDVPADVCGNCGEYYLSDKITGKIMKLAEDAVKKGAEVEITRFVA